MVVVPHHPGLYFFCWLQLQAVNVPAASALWPVLLIGWLAVGLQFGAVMPLAAAVRQDQLSLLPHLRQFGLLALRPEARALRHRGGRFCGSGFSTTGLLSLGRDQARLDQFAGWHPAFSSG